MDRVTVLVGVPLGTAWSHLAPAPSTGKGRNQPQATIGKVLVTVTSQAFPLVP